MIDLKRLRKEKGITQKELAQLLSCGQSFIANVENGRRDLPVSYTHLTLPTNSRV